MEKLILVKLGGSLITDKSKPFTARVAVIKRLANEIKRARKNMSGKMIIGHGSGSFGHTVASKYKTQNGIKNKNSVKGLSLVSDAAVQINRIVMQTLLDAKIESISFSPSSFITASNQNVDRLFAEPIVLAMNIGLLPVVYGDVILDKTRGCSIFSAEKTLDILAKRLRRDFDVLYIIQCVNTDGVYDENGNTIPKITSKSFIKFKKDILGSRSTDVTGGMLHKVEESLRLASETGIKTIIINGNAKGRLEDAILGKKIYGTVISS